MTITRTLPIIGALLLAACSSSTPDRTSGAPFEPNPCAVVETWCADGMSYEWTNDTGEPTCACMCDQQEDCSGSPVKSHCGVLLRESDQYPGGYESVFENGYPHVCRTSETEIP